MPHQHVSSINDFEKASHFGINNVINCIFKITIVKDEIN